MSDKAEAANVQENFSPQASLLFNQSFEYGKNAADLLKLPAADAKSSQLLEKSGVLPGVLMFDSVNNQQGDAKPVLFGDVNSSKVADTLKTDGLEVGGSSKLAKVQLEEPGAVKERIPGNLLNPDETIVYENNTKRTVSPDGAIRESRPSGMEIEITPDYRVTVRDDGRERHVQPTLPEENIVNTKIDKLGIVSFEYKNGATESFYPMGVHTMKNPDGSLDVTDENGKRKHITPTKETEYDENGSKAKEYERYPDKSLVRRDGNDHVVGTVSEDHKIRTFKYGPDGELNEMKGFTGDWKRMEDESGKSLWVNSTSGKVWHGNFKVDHEGNVHYAPNDRNAQAWMFTRDGKDVPEARKS